jgi:hypothetical protein
LISNRVTRVVCTAATAGLLLTGLAGPASPASAASAGNGASTPNGARAGSPAKFTTFPGRLYSVAATDANNVWAAGLHPDSSLIVHWNGTAWTQSFSSSLGYFIGVATDSRTDAWAVGGTNWFSPSSTLIEHWNGTAWTHVPSPSPDGGGYLNGVTAISRTDAWAVGLIASGGPGNSGATTTPLIEHWDGTSWTQVPCPIPASGGQFTSVSATSPTDVWAVGSTGDSSQQALIEHWDGTAWALVPAPSLPGIGNSLRSVDATSSADVWAVGTTDFTNHQQPLILHWNGTAWQQVASNSGSPDAQLNSVATISGSNAWAVGMTRPSTCNPECETLILHWNGTAWSPVPSPNPPAGYLNALLGVVAICPHNVWAVGSTDYAQTLITHWNGKTWS